MIAAGHSSSDVWSYSPRQISAFLFIAEKRRKSERAEELYLQAMASRGDMKVVKKTLKEWNKP